MCPKVWWWLWFQDNRSEGNWDPGKDTKVGINRQTKYLFLFFCYLSFRSTYYCDCWNGTDSTWRRQFSVELSILFPGIFQRIYIFQGGRVLFRSSYRTPKRRELGEFKWMSNWRFIGGFGGNLFFKVIGNYIAFYGLSIMRRKEILWNFTAFRYRW